jgi:hypothetical protein
MPIRHPAMSYRPGTWAKLSTLIAALGWFTQLWFASQRGADLAQGAFLNIFAALFLAVVPMVAGTICFYLGRHSQRAGDIGFAMIMVAQGVALAAVGAMTR